MAATSEELPARWPRYGPAVAELGIHPVAATPLRYGSDQFGALTAFDAAATHPTATLDELAQILLLPSTTWVFRCWSNPTSNRSSTRPPA